MKLQIKESQRFRWLNWLGEKLGQKHLIGTIKKLKEKGLIEYRGSKKTGGYFVK